MREHRQTQDTMVTFQAYFVFPIWKEKEDRKALQKLILLQESNTVAQDLNGDKRQFPHFLFNRL